MNDYIHVDPRYQSRRWVSFLDLLGFTKLIQTNDWVHVFTYYSQALDDCINKVATFGSTIEKAWFSDTFFLYSSDDTFLSFTEISSVTQSFVESLVCHNIPVRGAISCGDLYADKENNLFFGEALIEAYYYGENQNWIGFVLTPSCIRQMRIINRPADQRNDYRYWDIPYKQHSCRRRGKALEEKLFACILGGSILGYNACLDELRKMAIEFEGTDHITKYKNTIKFIEAHQVKL